MRSAFHQNKKMKIKESWGTDQLADAHFTKLML